MRDREKAVKRPSAVKEKWPQDPRVPHLSRMQFSSIPRFLLSYSRRALLVSMDSSVRSCHGGKGISIISFWESVRLSPL